MHIINSAVSEEKENKINVFFSQTKYSKKPFNLMSITQFPGQPYPSPYHSNIAIIDNYSGAFKYHVIVFNRYLKL